VPGLPVPGLPVPGPPVPGLPVPGLPVPGLSQPVTSVPSQPGMLDTVLPAPRFAPAQRSAPEPPAGPERAAVPDRAAGPEPAESASVQDARPDAFSELQPAPAAAPPTLPPTLPPRWRRGSRALRAERDAEELLRGLRPEGNDRFERSATSAQADHLT